MVFPELWAGGKTFAHADTTFTAPDLLFTDTSAPPGFAIYTPERERGYIALGAGSLASDPEILLAI